MRRVHKKSRFGCRECKQRHIKCDETRPSCVNCSTVRRSCSFLAGLTASSAAGRPPVTLRSATRAISRADSASVSSSPLSQSQSDACEAGSATNSSAANSCSRSVSPADCLIPNDANSQVEASSARCLTAPPTPTNQVFSLHHLELLHHWSSMKELHFDEARAEAFRDLMVRQACQTPCLMDQLLAVSAAHMSTVRLDRKEFYRNEATLLQTRAVASVNAAQFDVSDDNCISMLLFSILLAQQVMFETLSSRVDLPKFLDKLASWLTICGGIATIAGYSWNFFKTEARKSHSIGVILDGPRFREPKSNISGFLRLEELINAADLGSFSTDACLRATRILHAIVSHDSPDAAPIVRVLFALHWTVLVPPDFVKLVDQRRPEALAILAYFAVLLHHARGYWIVGDAGEFIIQAIAAHLGSSWAEWLAWPQAVLERTRKAAT